MGSAYEAIGPAVNISAPPEEKKVEETADKGTAAGKTSGR
uniref:Uncharacterized protein n=1 Tax=Setaria digitata TaxID=48799 RepID=A0A915Q5X3_9BILA